MKLPWASTFFGIAPRCEADSCTLAERRDELSAIQREDVDTTGKYQHTYRSATCVLTVKQRWYSSMPNPSKIESIATLYFGKDDAELDIASGGLLREGFLRTAAYEAAKQGQKNLIIGRKGSGKSAICMMLHKWPVGESGHASLVTPDEISADEIRRFELPGIPHQQSKTLLWRYILYVQVAKYIAVHARDAHADAPGAVKAVRRFLIENGELDDLSLSEKFWRMIERIKGSLSLEAFGIKVAADVEAPSEGIRASTQIDTLERGLLAALDALRDEGCRAQFLLLVDQLEKVWSNDRESDAMVVGLLNASKELQHTFGDAVRCVVFLRTDIYEFLNFQDRDKFRGSEFRIDWTPDMLLQLVLIRAQASTHSDLPADNLWGGLFPAAVSGEPTPVYAIKRTLLRPRDIIQLCNVCRDTAQKNGRATITEEDVREAARQFSTWKLLDLVGEWTVNYPFLNDLLVLVQSGSYLINRDDLSRKVEPIRDSLASRYREFSHYFNTDGVINIFYQIGLLGVVRSGRPSYAYEELVPVEPHEREFAIHPGFREALRATSAIGVPDFQPSFMSLSQP